MSWGQALLRLIRRAAVPVSLLVAQAQAHCASHTTCAALLQRCATLRAYCCCCTSRSSMDSRMYVCGPRDVGVCGCMLVALGLAVVGLSSKHMAAHGASLTSHTESPRNARAAAFQRLRGWAPPRSGGCGNAAGSACRHGVTHTAEIALHAARLDRPHSTACRVQHQLCMVCSHLASLPGPARACCVLCQRSAAESLP